MYISDRYSSSRKKHYGRNYVRKAETACDYKVIYQRFLKRESSPDRHRGHIVNDCYPETKGNNPETPKAKTISYENFVCGIEKRGFDAFFVGGRQIKVDTTDFSKINMEELFSQIASWKEEKEYENRS
mgnify:FL=1